MGRFLPTALSRLVVTKWDPTAPQTESLITFLDRRATDRQYNAVLGGPASLTGSVWANDPEINILFDDNYATPNPVFPGLFPADYPFLNEGVRLLRWFRKYRDQDDWTIRFAGHILDTVDTGDHNTGRTRFTAWDPWQYLFRRPCLRVHCLTDDCLDGTEGVDWELYATVEEALPGPAGIIFPAGFEITDIITHLLRVTIEMEGPVGIDAGTAWGGTAFFNGTINNVGPLASRLTFQQGTSVGQAWQQLVETAGVEIQLRAIWDPADRPGYLVELNVGTPGFLATGFDKPFFWDHAGHDLTGITREVDGRGRANFVKFYSGNPAAGKLSTATQSDSPNFSLERYGAYWNIETRERTQGGDTVVNQALQDLNERKAGVQTWTFSPAPEFTLRPFDDYDIGDYVDLYNSERLRQEVSLFGFARIRGFTINMSDEGVETVTAMEVWDDAT